MSALGKEVVNRIKRIMEMRGMKQGELAAAAKVPRPNMSNYFRGLNVPGLDVIERIAGALGVPAYVFFSDIDKDDQVNDIIGILERRMLASVEHTGRLNELNKRLKDWNEILLGQVERLSETGAMTEDEASLLSAFRAASSSGRKAILAAAEAVTSGKKDKARSRRVSKA